MGHVPASVAEWDGLEPALQVPALQLCLGYRGSALSPGVISLLGLELDAVASPEAGPSLVPCPPLVLAELIFRSSGDQHSVTRRVRCHSSSDSCLFLLAGSHSEEEETCFSEETPV